jgi:hypothetical protein
VFFRANRRKLSKSPDQSDQARGDKNGPEHQQRQPGGAVQALCRQSLLVELEAPVVNENSRSQLIELGSCLRPGVQERDHSSASSARLRPLSVARSCPSSPLGRAKKTEEAQNDFKR